MFEEGEAIKNSVDAGARLMLLLFRLRHKLNQLVLPDSRHRVRSVTPGRIANGKKNVFRLGHSRKHPRIKNLLSQFWWIDKNHLPN